MSSRRHAEGDLSGKPPTGPALTVEVLDGVGGPVVRVAGELDLTNVEQLGAVISPYATDDMVTSVTFDMGDLQFMDSSALTVLLQLSSSGTAVTLRHPSTMIREIVAATGLGGVLAIEPETDGEPAVDRHA